MFTLQLCITLALLLSTTDNQFVVGAFDLIVIHLLYSLKAQNKSGV